MANKSKLTPENRVKLQYAASIDASVEEMAYYCDVSRQTIYNWLEEDKELFDKIERLRANPVFTARQTVIDSLEDPNHAFKYLSKKKKDEFADNLDLTTQGESLKEINVVKNSYNKSSTQTSEEN